MEEKTNTNKIPLKFYTICGYAKLHVYYDKEGKPILKADGTPKTCSAMAIYKKLDAGVVKLCQLPGVEGHFINAEKYPPTIRKRGRKVKVKIPKQAAPVDLQKFVKETVEEIGAKKMSREEFREYMPKRHGMISSQIEFEFFVRMVKEYLPKS